MKKVMLIGFGAMAQAVIERLPAGVAIGWIVARASHHAAIHDQFGDAVEALTSPMACAQTPDLVLECASQQAVTSTGKRSCVAAGIWPSFPPARWRTARWSSVCSLRAEK